MILLLDYIVHGEIIGLVLDLVETRLLINNAKENWINSFIK